MISILSHQQNKQAFSHILSNSVWKAGSCNWRDMSTIWFWHMGIRAGPTKLSGWGKIYCCWTKALETGSCLHIQCAGDSPAYTNMKDSEENEKDSGSSFTTCPTLRPKCIRITKLFFEAQALQEPNPRLNHCRFCTSLVLPSKSQQNILNIESQCALMKINHPPFFRCCGHSGLQHWALEGSTPTPQISTGSAIRTRAWWDFKN